MTKSVNILIADDVHPDLMDGLKDAGLRYTYAPDATPERISELMSNHSILVIRSKMKITEEFMTKHPDLRLIARAGAGMETIDTDAAQRHGITCVSANEGNRDAVGEQTVGMMLALLTHLRKAHDQVANGVWDREGNRGLELGHRTVGIIGYGNTGSAVAGKLSGFGCRVLAYDKYKSGFGSESVEEVTLTELLSEADIITFHVPLTDETNQWINQAFIHSVSHPFVLLNLSRGGIMNTRDVLVGLESGKVVGLATDVLENENPSNWTPEERDLVIRLTHNPSVLVTPHVGGWTRESYQKISRVLLWKICDHLGLKPAQNDHFKPERLYVG